mgnify:CR=1 FL=1
MGAIGTAFNDGGLDWAANPLAPTGEEAKRSRGSVISIQAGSGSGDGSAPSSDRADYTSDQHFLLNTSLLPPYISMSLERLRQAELEGNEKTRARLDTAFNSLVENKDQRATLKTIHKWVVAFATWRYAAHLEKTTGSEVSESSGPNTKSDLQGVVAVGGKDSSPSSKRFSGPNLNESFAAAVAHKATSSNPTIEQTLSPHGKGTASLFVNTMSKLHCGESTLQGVHENGRGFIMATAREKTQGISNSIRTDTHTHKRGKLQQPAGTTATGTKTKVVDRGTFGSRSQIVVGMSDMAASARKDKVRAEWAAKNQAAKTKQMYTRTRGATITQTNAETNKPVTDKTVPGLNALASTAGTRARQNHISETKKKYGITASSVKKQSARGKTAAMLGDVQKMYAELSSMKKSI